jgi:glycolate oxidase iron-sulfur subunit
MKGIAEEKLEVDNEFGHNMYLCLGCRACETACPAGVPYGSLVETAREVVETTKKDEKKAPFVRNIIFNKVFPHPKRLEKLGTALWAAQSAVLQTMAHGNKFSLQSIEFNRFAS